MISFFRDLARDAGSARTVIVVDEAESSPPKQYRLQPRMLFGLLGAGVLLSGVILTMLLIVTPLRTVVFGPDPETLRETAQLTAIRAAALADSLEVQREYLEVLRATLTGVEPAVVRPEDGADGGSDEREPEWLERPVSERSENWMDHEPGALAPEVFGSTLPISREVGASERFLTHLQFPALAPVSGFFARGYDAARGHFGVDIAVDEDTPVRSVGDGYVVLADWTNDGGFVIAVQHAGGFLSLYKHNRRLTKRVGDRVRSRETIAYSGNTGELTTGPHLHFELWRNGLAQDPRQYLVGL